MLSTKQMLGTQVRGGIDVCFIYGASSLLLSPQSSERCSRVSQKWASGDVSRGGGSSSAPQIHMDLYLGVGVILTK